MQITHTQPALTPLPAQAIPTVQHATPLLRPIPRPAPLTRPRPASLVMRPHVSGSGRSPAWIIAGELHSTPCPTWEYRPAFFRPGRFGHVFEAYPQTPFSGQESAEAIMAAL